MRLRARGRAGGEVERETGSLGLRECSGRGRGAAGRLGAERAAAVSEDGLDGEGVLHGGEDAQPAATAGAGEDVEVEHGAGCSADHRRTWSRETPRNALLCPTQSYLEPHVASRIAVPQPSAARPAKQRNIRSTSAPQPAIRQQTFHRELAPPVPFSFADISLFSRGEQPLLREPLPWPIQAKLTIGVVNDPLEREADQVADRVMRMPDHAVAAPSSTSANGEQVQRKCESCAEEEEKQTVRRKCQSCTEEEEHGSVARKQVGRAASLDGTAAPSIVGDVLRSPGRPLDTATRSFFEPRFGYDFGRVRIHSDSQAAASAQSIRASAYTVGRDVVFGASQFSPHTPSGRSLLAHELAHVVQQDHAPMVRRVPAPRPAAADACNTDQHKHIDPAANRSSAWLARAVPALEAFLNGAKTKEAQAAGVALGKHFHSTDPAIGNYVLSRLKTIQGDIPSRHIFRCPPASDTVCGTRTGGQEVSAVVPDANPNEIDLCKAFFDRSEEDCASTIIHEFGHAQLGLGAKQKIDDRGYQWDTYYAYLTTAEALTNAESYAMFAREVATGFSPAKGFIYDSLNNCPRDWNAPISDAITKARMWNHQAALHTRARHEFSRAFKVLDTKLESNFDFKCIPDGGGRCEGNKNVAYWYMAGDLRICPRLIGITSPDERAISLLSALYGYESLVDGSDRQYKAAREAKRLHSANVPSTAEVLKEK
jgi:uncharacterized protein DUF4157/lysine-specific metallo-endopeptidase family protein